MPGKRPIAGDAGLFTPEEHLVLATWLEVPPLVTKRGLAPDRALAGVLRGVQVADFLDRFDLKLPVGVAAIVLKHVQDELPQWGAMTPRGLTLGRHVRRPTGPVAGDPVLLFRINWATSAPGFEWPAAYHVTPVPGYERSVVTESADSPDASGACDLAVGYFESHEDRLEASRDVIVAHWIGLAARGQTRFEALQDEGLLDAHAVEEIADLIWG